MEEILRLINEVISLFTTIGNLVCAKAERKAQQTDALKSIILALRLLPIETKKQDCDFGTISERLRKIPPILETYYDSKIAEVFDKYSIDAFFAVRYKAEVKPWNIEELLEHFISACKKCHYKVQ